MHETANTLTNIGNSLEAGSFDSPVNEQTEKVVEIKQNEFPFR